MIELLVSISLFALLMTMFLTLSSTLLKKWHLLDGKQKSTTDAGLFFERMTRELHCGVLLPDTFFIDLFTYDPCCRKNIFFLVPSSSKKSRGRELCGVGYFFVEDPGNPHHHQCFRFSLSPEETWTALQTDTLAILFATVSPRSTSSCKQVASHIMEWKIRPVWMADGKVSGPPSTSLETVFPPKLIEIKMTTDDEITFSSVVALFSPQ